ncbi:MAG: four helix bundle suffix domain-containing protein, partial [Prevotella sp.]|nr:four helix bundle suffix domain-containing protein [Prevotella sp.]
IKSHHLEVWNTDNPRQQRLRDFCHSNNDYEAYAPMVEKMNDEEFANLMLTLCHQTDKLMCAYLEKLEHIFVTEGGIKERMYAARTGYRQEQDAYIANMENENKQLKEENAGLRNRTLELEAEVKSLGARLS